MPGDTARRAESIALDGSAGVVKARQLVRALAQEAGLSLVDQTKLVTAASELARNTVVHGGGGHMEAEPAWSNGRSGVRLVFADEGPGIPDVELALTDGWTTGGGMGLGLSGAKRLADEFELDTGAGRGTRVTIVKWAR
ncbi:ATP-binding protein [Streptomyces diastaticus]|uniref:Sigma-B negative effector n=3 Tax=Streptomyces TaxID=1883 RepID=A0A380P4A9_STRGR|nr:MULTISPECIES: ATP-binding protein [Streptomyces]NEE31716.1 anti-sigma regulatory factor [Streptomyces sp. SID7982]NEE46726.1 anti-sigma regulatory factor [Streptomyces sp. SID8455]MBL3803689.1 ATP-binding protein [Streptomyces sp. BRB081]NEC11722.1 anti-sigma regulatory factor [Streptomyces sp. SID8014]PJM83795.1 anti-sigma regulatory factor [Streptomyces sp. TSRI0384-2]